jgi:hypothetical protein
MAVDGVVVVVVVPDVFETNLIRPQNIRLPEFLFKQEIKSIEKLQYHTLLYYYHYRLYHHHQT